MSRTKVSLVHILEMIAAGAVIAGIFQDQALIGCFVTAVVLTIIYLLNGGDNGQ